MKNWIKLSTVTVVTALFASSAIAQDQKDNTTKNSDDKSQEIVIRKKGGTNEKMTIVLDGDNVTINGKPVDEYKNKDVTVFKRDRSLALAPHVRSFSGSRPPMDVEDFDVMRPSSPNKAMLGVMTEKADDGVKIKDITKESGAEKAGLQKDDVITKVGSKNVKAPEYLVEAISSYKPNDKVDITYKRNGKENKTSVTLSENKSRAYAYNFNNGDFNFDFPKGSLAPQNFNFNFDHKPRIGLQIQDLEEGKGVKVKDVDEDSPAAKAGLKEGDVITQLNGKDVAGVDELRDAIRDVKEGETVKFSYKRDGKKQTVEVKMPKRLKSADL